MEHRAHIATLISSLVRRDDLDQLVIDLSGSRVDNVVSTPGIDESIVRYFDAVPALRLRWCLDFLTTTIQTLDTGIDLVMGACTILPLPQVLDPANTVRLAGSRFFAHHDELQRALAAVRVFDDGSPNYLAYFKVEDGSMRDRVYLSYSTYRERIFDLELSIDAYVALGTAAAFVADWQLALLAIKKHSTQNILHYLPALFPELLDGEFLSRLVARGLTDESFAHR